MIGIIFRRELLDLLSSWRFAILAAMLVLLGSVVVVVRSTTHTEVLSDYAAAEKLRNELLDRGLAGGRFEALFSIPSRRPARMSPLAQGTQDGILERMFYISIYEDPISVLYPSVDLLAVLGIVISLGALVLSSDLICGERETGTIRLVTANAVKRSSLLLGKWLACLATLGTGILLLFVVVALAVVLMGPDVWTIREWGAFGLLFLFSLVYASAFLAIGMFLSATTRHSGTAAVLALLVWAVSVFVLPSLPTYAARELYPVMSPTYARLGKVRVEKRHSEAEGKLKASLRDRGLSEAEAKAAFEEAEPALLEKFHREVLPYERAAVVGPGIQGLITAIGVQISPFAAYVTGAAEIAGVGVASGMHFVVFADRQEKIQRRYFKEKRQAFEKQHPGEKVRIDPRNRPRAVYRGDPFEIRLLGMAIPLLSLLLFNVLFFVLAWRKFLRYDVR